VVKKNGSEKKKFCYQSLHVIKIKKLEIFKNLITNILKLI
jgi:hypothetical protein